MLTTEKNQTTDRPDQSSERLWGVLWGPMGSGGISPTMPLRFREELVFSSAIALRMEKWSWRALKDMMTLMMRRDVVTRSSQSRWWIAHEDMGTAWGRPWGTAAVLPALGISWPRWRSPGTGGFGLLRSSPSGV